jgi:hypothetical protein
MTNEFKVDKLGWYENTNTGAKLKLVHFTKEVALFIPYEDATYVVGYDFKGYYKNNQPIDILELDKYLGPELPKEPRKFEFEDYISNNSIIPFSVCLLTVSHSNSNSKWRITMEELIE